MNPPGTPPPSAAVVLANSHVRLEPLTLGHVPDLLAAASEDRSHYQWTFVPRTQRQMSDYVQGALAEAAAGNQMPFATVQLPTGRVVGSTRFADLASWQWPPRHPRQRHGRPDAVEIGWTWLAASAQRTGVNTAAKLAMLTHAFEVWEVHRVRLRTDERNNRSRRAIERLGATLDGVLRRDRPATDDTVRDSAVYSIVASEWPAARERLTYLLAQGT